MKMMMTSDCEIPFQIDRGHNQCHPASLCCEASISSLSTLNQAGVLMVAPPRELHGDTLAALQEFYSERLSREERFQDLENDVERKSSQAQLSMDTFSEDWNASQFWVLCS